MNLFLRFSCISDSETWNIDCHNLTKSLFCDIQKDDKTLFLPWKGGPGRPGQVCPSGCSASGSLSSWLESNSQGGIKKASCPDTLATHSHYQLVWLSWSSFLSISFTCNLIEWCSLSTGRPGLSGGKMLPPLWWHTVTPWHTCATLGSALLSLPCQPTQTAGSQTSR